MLPIHVILLLSLAALPVTATARQTAIGFSTLEDFEDYATGPKSLNICPGYVGPGNDGFDCQFGMLQGGSVMAETAQFPAASGNQVYAGTSISLLGSDAFNNSWPGISARVSSGSSAVTLTLFRYDYTLDTEVAFYSSTLAAGLTNRLMGSGTPDDPLSLTRFTFASQSMFTIDDLQLGLEGVAPGIPEPTVWALMITGFGAVGGVLRQRRRVHS